MSGGQASAQDISRRKPVIKSRVVPGIEQAIVALGAQTAWLGQARASMY